MALLFAVCLFRPIQPQLTILFNRLGFCKEYPTTRCLMVANSRPVTLVHSTSTGKRFAKLLMQTGLMATLVKRSAIFAVSGCHASHFDD